MSPRRVDPSVVLARFEAAVGQQRDATERLEQVVEHLEALVEAEHREIRETPFRQAVSVDEEPDGE